MEVLITILISVLSGLAFIIYKKPQLGEKLLYRVFFIWSGISIMVMFAFKINSLEFQEIIRRLENVSMESAMDKIGVDKAIKIINDKITSYEKIYTLTLSSLFMLVLGLIGLYFFSSLMLAHKEEAKKAKNKAINESANEQ